MSEKKLILFMPFIGGGGVEKNLYIISNYLAKKVNNLTICTLSKDKKYKFTNKINFLTSKIKVNQKINIKLKYILCLYILFKFLLKNRNSVVFAFQANIYCILLCKFLNIPIIVRSNSSPSGWYHNSFKKLLYKKIISKANIVIVNSLIFKKQMEHEFKLKAKCIYNPLDQREIIFKSKTAKKDNFFNNKKSLKILNIGRLTKQKDQIVFLKALNLLKINGFNFKSIILGSGIEEKNLKNFIKKNNLSHQIKIRKFKENPYGLINQCDLFILSSRYEGLPNVLLEAAVLKKMIISTDCPTGPREILSNGKGGLLFKIGDFKQLKNKIIKFSKNKKKFNKEINYSYKNLKRFNFDKNLYEYYKVIKKLLIIN
jgi:glycosyltransferase involved in cell wall biosynthesis